MVGSTLFFEHQFLHFLFVFLLFFQVEHGSEHMIPQCGTYSITIVLVLVVMEMMIAPQGFHPFKWRIPRVNSIMHGPIHEVAEYKARKESKHIPSHCQVHNSKKS